MQFRTPRSATKLLVGLCLCASTLPAATIGQIDTFQDGTTQGWLANLLGFGVHPDPPKNVATGGPGGAGDAYLELNSFGGGGAGSRLVALNVAQWTGDFSGITAISMDVNNQGQTDLNLRLMFAAGGPPTDVAVSSEAILLPAGSGWTKIVLPILSSDLTAVMGDVGVALGQATEMRIFHSTAATFPGDTSAAQLGIDNIEAIGDAVVIPEPGTFALIGLGLCLAALRLHRR